MARRASLVLGALGVLAVALSTPPVAATSARAVTLGPVIRITTPGESTCPVEGEPDVLRTSAGIWVGYNDDHECVFRYYLGQMRRLTSVQLIPAGGGAPRYVDKLLPTESGALLAGDPALAADPRMGGVYLATLYINTGGDVTIEVFRITPSMAVSRLPSPRVHPEGRSSDDKEFLASDTNRRSRWFGRVYLAWDDFSVLKLVFRAWDGKRWLKPVTLGDIGKADVAVAPNGDVAVAYEVPNGVATRISKDGGRTFGDPVVAIGGADPGRQDPTCPLRPTVGQRQRATKAVRVTYDPAGRLHVVAAVAPATTAVPRVGLATGGASDVAHAVSANGVTWQSTRLGDPARVRFHPAVAVTPSGGVAVAYLQTSDDAMTTYDAWLQVAPRGTRSFGAPVRLSTAPATFPAAMEAQLNSNCYGIGDYIGLAATPRGVVAAWPTTDAETTPHVDSDVLVREAFVR